MSLLVSKKKKHPNERNQGGNIRYWLSEYSEKELLAYKNEKQSLTGQNVKVLLSDAWTFEYSLAFNGLAKEVYESINKTNDGFDALPEDTEERAIYIYKLIDEGRIKTQVSYDLVEILTRDYHKAEQWKELKDKLPKYINDAIEYVTEPLGLAEVQENEVQEVVANGT